MKIKLDLSEEEAEKMCEVLSEYWDRGPSGEGWQSDTLSRLSGKVTEAVEQAQKDKQ